MSNTKTSAYKVTVRIVETTYRSAVVHVADEDAARELAQLALDADDLGEWESDYAETTGEVEEVELYDAGEPS